MKSPVVSQKNYTHETTMRRSIKAIGAAVLAAALITSQAQACTPVPGNVMVPHWPGVGEFLVFHNDYDAGVCPTPEEAKSFFEANALIKAGHSVDVKTPGCFWLRANATYEIHEVGQQYNDAVFYRVGPDWLWIFVANPAMVPVAVCE